MAICEYKLSLQKKIILDTYINCIFINPSFMEFFRFYQSLGFIKNIISNIINERKYINVRN